MANADKIARNNNILLDKVVDANSQMANPDRIKIGGYVDDNKRESYNDSQRDRQSNREQTRRDERRDRR